MRILTAFLMILSVTAAAEERSDAGTLSPARREFILFPPGDDQSKLLTIQIYVGEEADVDAGLAFGLMCDDITFFSWAAEGQTHLLFKGVKPGSTLCRFGLPRVGYANRLVQLTVESAKPSAPKG